MADASELIKKLAAKKLKIITAESCSGGLMASSITAVAGSSKVYQHGFVTYSNASKIKLLGVAKSLIEKHGAVSREVAGAMAENACGKTDEYIAVSATGIAGPSTSEHKPVGLVYIGVCHRGRLRVTQNHLTGSREEIQAETVSRAFDLVLSVIK